MFSKRAIAAFLVKLTVGYVFLAALWSVVGEAYAQAFRRTAAGLFGALSEGVRVRFAADSQGDGQSDTMVTVRKRGFGRRSFPLRLRVTAYDPAAFMLALLIATPSPLRRRILVLFGSMVLVHGFIALRLWFRLLAVASVGAQPLIQLSGAEEAIVATGLRLTILSSSSFAVPLIIWLTLAFRPNEWTGTHIRAEAPQAPSAQT